MDDIYRGILLSNHGDLVKRTLIEKCILPAAAVLEENGTLTCHGILQIALDTAAQSSDPNLQELSCVVFETWARQHSKHLLTFFTPNVFRHRLTKEQYPNKATILRLASFVIGLADIGDVGSLHQVVLDTAVYLLDADDSLNVASSLAAILTKLDAERSPSFDRLLFMKRLVRCMARSHPRDMPQLLTLVKNADIVAGYVRHLLSAGDSLAVMHCFQEMFAILSTGAESQGSCSCLAAILSVIPPSVLQTASKSAMLGLQFSDETWELMFRRLLEWVMWPRAKNLDLVIIHVMGTLECIGKGAVLIKVTQKVAYQLFLAVRSTLCCESVLPVLLKMLLSYQHSPDVFHSIVPCVPFVLECLEQENSSQNCEVASQLIAMVHTLMDFYSGFPEIYNPVLCELQKHPKCNPEKVSVMKDFLSKNQWTCKAVLLTSVSTLQAKSSTGKVGLCNLGNTCYVNSVLQALYMNDEFRNEILVRRSSELQSLFLSIQNVFLFLTHSQRAAYSPEELLRVTRPPWFRDGHQQDCSEYMRYFLDKLHEQDVITVPSKDNKLCNVTSGAAGSQNGDSCAKCLIHDLFGGQLEISYRCFNCQHVSRQSETFIDLSLALVNSPATKTPVDSAVDNATETSVVQVARPIPRPPNLKLDDLLHFYFTPEMLVGDNCYQCENCCSLHEAVKTTKVTQAPKYLILTLLRFSYDQNTHQRTKILQHVDFPEVLRVPVSHRPHETQVVASVAGGPTTAPTNESELYSLYAVVMHSGSSSDSGHYYTYACHSSMLPELFSHDKEVVTKVAERSWYLFNDSRVSFSQFTTFCNASQQFSRDTAYLLFYRKITVVGVSSSRGMSQHDPKTLKLRDGLIEAVHKDNLLYLQELEDEARREEEAKKARQKNSFWKDFDDKNPPGSCGGDGFGGFGVSARFVC